jgi:short-subunit dehydrogenase
MLNVENKVVVITGASSGIGEATAKLLAQNGAKVVLGARQTEKLEQIVAEIRATGGTAEFKAVDVTDRENMKAFVHFANDKFDYFPLFVCQIARISHFYPFLTGFTPNFIDFTRSFKRSQMGSIARCTWECN